LGACTERSAPCRTVLQEVPLKTATFDGEVVAGYLPPLLFVNQSEVYWHLPADTAVVRALVALSPDATGPAMLPTTTSELLLADTVGASTNTVYENAWPLDPGVIVEVEGTFRIASGPKAFYLRHEGPPDLAPLHVYRLEAERVVCD
jgi:hypothetical protein